MLFSSLVFLFRFLPIALLLYFLFFLPAQMGGPKGKALRKLSNLVLLLLSLFF